MLPHDESEHEEYRAKMRFAYEIIELYGAQACKPSDSSVITGLLYC